MKKNDYEYELFVPYRICPLGAHVDHQLGLVTGFAIDKGITMKYSKMDNGNFLVTSYNFSGVLSFNYSNLPEKNNSWQDYLVAAILSLGESYKLNYGIKANIEKSLPIGGLASSSAIILSYILGIAKVNNIVLKKEELVLLEVRAESKYLNTKIGTLDPSCEIYSKKNSLLYLDTLDNSYKLIKSKKKNNFKICLIFSGLTRRLTNTYYNVNVDECKSVAFSLNYFLNNTPIEFKDAYLRNFSINDFLEHINYFPTDFVKRAKHFYSEIDRVITGIKFFEDGNLEEFGKLIFASGDSSINNYEAGSEQLITLHNISKKVSGIYGGRFSGAGYNGFYMALINPDKEKEIEIQITAEYLKIYPQYKDTFKIYFCNTYDGINL